MMLVFVFTLTIKILNYNKIIIGVAISDHSMGLRSISSAKKIIQSEVEKFKSREIIITYNNYTWQSFPEDLGITYDIDRTLVKAQNIGRKKGIRANIGQQFKGIFKKYNLPLEINWDEEKFNNFYLKNLAKLDNPSRNAKLEFKNNLNEFNLIPEEPGNIINKKKFTNDILNKILFLSTATINLEVIADIPEATLAETDIAQKIIQQISKNLPITLETKYNKLEIPTDDLINLLEFPAEYPQEIKKYFQSDNLEQYSSDNKILGVSLNKQKAEDYVTVLSTGINRNPVNAELQIKNDKVTTFALSQNGIKINIKESSNNFIEGVKAGEKSIMLVYEEIAPEITTENIDNLGIKKLISKGESNFFGSPNSRKHNIQVGSLKFHGVIIDPDEEFSFNKILGEIGPQTGYLPELVIKKDKTIPEYGGGLCQVSTTAFRAAINAGLEITERFPHSFPVVYYAPQGFDATIYPPHPDLRFINNTEGHLLIQTKVVNNNLTFEFYGTDDGRTVEIDGPYQYDFKPDGSMKAKLTQKVYDADNNLLREETFYSNYKSPNLYPVKRNPLE